MIHKVFDRTTIEVFYISTYITISVFSSFLHSSVILRRILLGFAKKWMTNQWNFWKNIFCWTLSWNICGKCLKKMLLSFSSLLTVKITYFWTTVVFSIEKFWMPDIENVQTVWQRFCSGSNCDSCCKQRLDKN